MSLAPKDAYAELIQKSVDLATFGSAMAVLGWDQRTKMPKGAAQHRGNQFALMAGMAHKMSTDPRVAELLEVVEDSALVSDPLSVEAVNVREIRRSYDHATKLPQRLVEEFSKVTAESYTAWIAAREQSDFKMFAPHLEKVVALTREKADALGWEGTRYNALLDQFEPGLTKDEVTAVFDPLEKELSEIVQKIAASKKAPDPKILDNDYPVAEQKKLGRQAAALIGFNFDNGRLDTTTHPFCSGMGPQDCRITTRYNPRNFIESFTGVLHEAGHGLYEQGLATEHYGTPMGDTAGLGVHESQSRLWENLVGRSKGFWKYFLPVARKAFPVLKNVTVDDFYFALNKSEPTFIRVEADEATYNLHIILRFRLETALLEGNLEPKDVPGAWNELFKKGLGLVVDKDSNGCLQDVHWSEGYIGYFPTYTLGTVYASQFFAKAKDELGDLEAQFERGEFLPLKKWLTEKVHLQGMRYRSSALCEFITGEPLNADYLLTHLKTRYGELYGF